MEIVITKDYDEMSALAAQIIADQLLGKPNSVLGLATGGTPVGTYRELVRLHREGTLDFSKTVTFNLDEYVGLPKTHEQSYYHFMQDQLFSQINIRPESIHVPDGMAEDIDAYCEWYEGQIVEAGGIDLQLLGIGRDGHIAFNEPVSSLGSRTRLKTLTKETIEDNARFFAKKGDVPRYAITMGVGTILEAKHCLLIANGASKAKIVAELIEGPITAMVTASALQLHSKATIVLDEEAAAELKLKDYYQWVWSQKDGHA